MHYWVINNNDILCFYKDKYFYFCIITLLIIVCDEKLKTKMKPLYHLIFFVLCAVFLTACEKDHETPSGYFNEVMTGDVTEVSHNSAIVAAEIHSDCTERGVCYGTENDPTIEGSSIRCGSGSGSYTATLFSLHSNTVYHVRAYAKDGQNVVYGASKSFTTKENETPIWSDGTIPNLFSVGDSKTIRFSRGNLQYIGDGRYWQFAEHQWDYLGDNGQGGGSESADRDLFGWGTSGYGHGSVCYQPWSISENFSDYYVYGNPNYDLFSNSHRADWGYNAISNGGNEEGLWRTLTKDEWLYLFTERNTSSGISFAKAIVNRVQGVILLPDDWSSGYYTLHHTNQGDADFSSNTISSTIWELILEAHGAVFLPAAGGRYGTSLNGIGDYGNYWSSSFHDSGNAWSLLFKRDDLSPNNFSLRCGGFSVRLVR